MLYKKTGYPEEDELVLCTVTKIHYHSVFCKLDEYDKSGMIHISEVSPGRIRNINNYVQEGKKVVCKILRVNLEKGHIDLSLRRVNETQRKAKLNMIKQEQKAEKIVQNLADKLKKSVDEVYRDLTKALFEEYEMLFMAFEDVVENDANLEKLGVSKTIAKPLTEIIKDKIKPKQVVIGGEMILTSYDSEGVEIVKKALMSAEKDGSEVKYKGAGKYGITVTAPDYKSAEKILAECIGDAKSIIEGKDGTFEFERA